MKIKKICKTCGKEFETPYPQKKFCSHRCYNLALRKSQSITKKCETCGNEFYAPRNTKYCSERCRQLGGQYKFKSSSQLCWTCQRATGYCSWSASLKPIKGWDAKLVKFKEGGYTYKIKDCPLYLPDEIKRKD